jgi:hypothetical protein
MRAKQDHIVAILRSLKNLLCVIPHEEEVVHEAAMFTHSLRQRGGCGSEVPPGGGMLARRELRIDDLHEGDMAQERSSEEMDHVERSFRNCGTVEGYEGARQAHVAAYITFRTHKEERDVSMTDEAIGDAAKQRALHTPIVVARHDDQIRLSA